MLKNINTGYRALAILENYLLSKEIRAIKTWLIPSTICFSVPLLFIRQKKTIIFYDFGFDSSNILKAITKSHKKKTLGVVINNYFGHSWDKDQIIRIRQKTTVIIEDSCLSCPNLNKKNKNGVNLNLYSTGPGKYLNLKYGSFCITENHRSFNFIKKTEKENLQIAENFKNLEDSWKKSIQQKNIFKDDKGSSSEWINNSQIDSIKYFKEVSARIPKVVDYKKKLNKIYYEIIPSDLQWDKKLNEWRFNILIDSPRYLLREFFKNQLFASSHYANTEKYFNGHSTLKKSSFIERHIVNLFNDFSFTTDQAEKTSNIIKKLYLKNKIKPVKSKPLINSQCIN